MDNIRLLARAFLTVTTEEECVELFKDICTEKELEEMSNRFLIALMLYERKTFVEIEERTRSSSATISRVNRSLKLGSGYREVLDKVLTAWQDEQFAQSLDASIGTSISRAEKTEEALPDEAAGKRLDP